MTVILDFYISQPQYSCTCTYAYVHEGGGDSKNEFLFNVAHMQHKVSKD